MDLGRGNRRSTARHILVTVLVLCASALAPVAYGGAASAASGPSDPLGRYLDRAGAPLTVHRDGHGRVDFVGSRSAGVLPLGTSVSPGAAARRQLDRLGGVLGTAGRDLRPASTQHSVDGGSVTRMRQYVDGLPVLGGEVVVGLDRHGGLSSAATRLSDADEGAADDIAGRARRLVTAVQARRTARTVVRRAHPRSGPLHVHEDGTWLYDDSLVSGPPVGRRQVYRLTVGNGVGVRETVLVDAEAGRVLMHVDDTPELDRTVCDLDNTRWTGSGAFDCNAASRWKVRGEGQPASGVADADSAYDLLGATSDFYATLGVDLTDLIGTTDGSRKTIAATVRFCQASPAACPMDNGFWNGTAMYIGEGYAVDDVVAHELTHGVIERTDDLFYYQQSGAINESLADTMGEIVDHRYPSVGDLPGNWEMGEALADGPVRSLSDPPAYGQPDRMTSPLWHVDDNRYGDNGGVHANSGVGNKTAYLIAHGGTFNGRTVLGIDAADPRLTKTATLYMYVIQHLVSGSQYADLGRVLVQGCQSLAAAGTAGFTSADCTQVSNATAATELSQSPTVAGGTRPPEAPATCPTGTKKRVLATPALSADDSGLWNKAPGPGIPNNSRDGDGDDFGYDPDPAYDKVMKGSLTSPKVAVPAGQRTYLWFSQWYQYEWYHNADGSYSYWDGAQVGVDPGSGVQLPAASAWVNGPTSDLLLDDDQHPVKGFGGDSNGWISSRLDLSGYAGRSVAVDWVTRGDSTATSFFGWFVDEVSFYTCDPQPLTNTAAPRISGTAQVGKTLTASSGSWSPAPTSVTYQWLRNGAAISGATRSSYTATGSDLGKRLSVKVTAANGDWKPTAKTSAQTAAVKAGTLTAPTPKISGTTTVGRTLTAVPGTWKPSGVTLSYRWLRNGAAITGATRKTYVLTKADRGTRISVRVGGKKTGYTSRTVTSARTSVIR